MGSRHPSLLVLAGADAGELTPVLERRGARVEAVQSAAEAVLRIDSAYFDAVLVEVAGDGVALLALLYENRPDVPLIAFGREPESEQALAAGALEYLSLPVHEEALARAVDAALARERAAVLEPAAPPLATSELLGVSQHMLTVRETIARVAPGSSTVFVRGETGTGKELVARAIHATSARRDRPFVKVHAAALPEELLESELFGYEKGAFTGAVARKPGRVELAEGGSLFLDEIGEISLKMQAKLLRLIQDREYERLGGAKTLRADVRFIAATHRDIKHMVEQGTFREDLMYRLDVVTVWLPPLRARRDDIPVIADHYLGKFRGSNHKPAIRLDARAVEFLKAQRWTGNVRELVNFVERMVVLAKSDVIGLADVQRELEEHETFTTQSVPQDRDFLRVFSLSGSGSALASEPPALPLVENAAPPRAQAGAPADVVRPLRDELREAERRALVKALTHAGGNRTLAARMLGISRRTLYTKLDEHGLG
jgi:two-component system, NtrC family, response regulator AtoC